MRVAAPLFRHFHLPKSQNPSPRRVEGVSEELFDWVIVRLFDCFRRGAARRRRGSGAKAPFTATGMSPPRLVGPPAWGGDIPVGPTGILPVGALANRGRDVRPETRNQKRKENENEYENDQGTARYAASCRKPRTPGRSSRTEARNEPEDRRVPRRDGRRHRRRRLLGLRPGHRRERLLRSRRVTPQPSVSRGTTLGKSRHNPR